MKEQTKQVIELIEKEADKNFSQFDAIANKDKHLRNLMASLFLTSIHKKINGASIDLQTAINSLKQKITKKLEE